MSKDEFIEAVKAVEVNREMIDAISYLIDELEDKSARGYLTCKLWAHAEREWDMEIFKEDVIEWLEYEIWGL